MKIFTLFKKIPFLLCCFLFVQSLEGQTVGSFDANINFGGTNRQLSAYVPTNYNPSNKYKLMVCLHGLGDNSVNYRNALVTTLNWKTLLPNTILICPESSSTTVDYFEPAGSKNEEIIKESINFIRATYNVDTTDIILQGFSLGGRAALRYGLENPSIFKGLLLNTPAIQGVKEGTDKQPAYKFNFSNASILPIYMSHGEDDIFYTAPIDSIVEQLILNNSPLHFKRIAGLNHTIPQSVQLGDFTKFFDSTITTDFGIEVSRIYIPERTCDGKINGGVLVRNTGKTTIQSVSLDFSITGSTPIRVLSSGLNLAPFQHAVLPITNQFAGSNETLTFTVKASVINTNVDTDPFSPNNENRRDKDIVNQSTGRALPFNEGFDGTDFPPLGWTINASGDIYTVWDRSEDAKKSGAASMGTFNTVLFFDNSFRVEEIQTPVLDLTSLANPHLTFDLAYNYHKFKAGTDSVLLADTLEVMISTDCGKSFTRLFRNGGKGLATFATPILNPNTVEKCYISPADSNWVKVLLPLNGFATNSNVIISFRYQSGLGGSINIDNVSIGSNTLGIKTPQENTVTLYPNPAKTNVRIGADNIVAVNVFDAGGKQCSLKSQQLADNTLVLFTDGLNTGIYHVQVIGKDYVANQKLVVEK